MNQKLTRQEKNHIIVKQRQAWSSYPICLSLLAICCLSVITHGCTKSSRVTSPAPSQHHAEKQLLQTVAHAESLGKGNPLVLSSLYSLATYYRSQGQYEKAEAQYKKALQLKEELSGPDHPDIVTILENYAALLREAKRYSEAENLASRAAAIMAKSSSTSPIKSRSN